MQPVHGLSYIPFLKSAREVEITAVVEVAVAEKLLQCMKWMLSSGVPLIQAPAIIDVVCAKRLAGIRVRLMAVSVIIV